MGKFHLALWDFSLVHFIEHLNAWLTIINGNWYPRNNSESTVIKYYNISLVFLFFMAGPFR